VIADASMWPFPAPDDPGRVWQHVPMRTIHTFILLALCGCEPIRSFVIGHYPTNYEPPAMGSVSAASYWADGVPGFTGKDVDRDHVSVQLTPVLKGLEQPTDLVFFPDSDTQGLMLEKEGRLSRFDLEKSTTETVKIFDVLTQSEQGLVGIALHPNFEQNRRFFLHQSVKNGESNVGQVSCWRLDSAGPTHLGIILQIEQPYPNHNAGQIAFGPDGMFYMGLGDGGWRNDPHENGQNGSTLLGSMLRINVETGQGYTVPEDNPFVADSTVANEAWATGLRNPWKFSFTPDGQMVIADVGQNAFEEVSLVSAGDNLGWNVREGRHCFPPENTCSADGLVEPIYEYDRSEGQSITGGFVASSAHIPAIQNHYVFGDFVSGRLWAIPLDADPDGSLAVAKSLGQWPFLPSTFGQSANGTLFVADFGKGFLYRLDPR
jgi:glucose/arabinose dehydrogenase